MSGVVLAGQVFRDLDKFRGDELKALSLKSCDYLAG
jgi:hypothetical protein